MAVETGTKILDIALCIKCMAWLTCTCLNMAIVINMTLTAGKLLWIIIQWPRVSMTMLQLPDVAFEFV